MGQALRPAWRVGVQRAGAGGLEGSARAREGEATHWLTEGLGLGGPHVQVGHHGLQPLALLGQLWRAERLGVSRGCAWRQPGPVPPPHSTGLPGKPLFPPPLASQPQQPSSLWPCLSAPSHPQGQDRDRLLHEALLASPPDCVSQALEHQQAGALSLTAHTPFLPTRAEAVAEQHPSLWHLCVRGSSCTEWRHRDG